MKTPFFHFAFLLLCISIPLTGTAQIINIPDTNLRTAVEKKLGKTQGATITADDMVSLTRLGAPNSRINSLTGLESAINLTVLSFEHNSISSLKPLAGLIHLTQIWIMYNHISDISPLAGLTNLTKLHIHQNSIYDISPLASLTNLTELDLSGNSISDLSPLASLTNLTELNLSGNSISDLSPLTNLTNLKSLGLGRSLLSYQSIYTHIPTLQSRGTKVYFRSRTPMYLKKISGNGQQGSINTTLAKPFIVKVTDENLVPFEGVPVAFAIIGGNGQLSVINTTTDKKGRAESLLTLGPNPGTNTVTVAAARISDSITFSATTEQLVLIPDPNLRNGIEAALGKSEDDPITLSDISMLTDLNIRTAETVGIRDLTGLEFATGLKSLKLWVSPRFSTQLDVSPIAGLTNLSELSIGNYSISDIAPIADLVNLKSLNFGGSAISDISAVAGLTNLTSLNLSVNSISDISAVVGLTNLTYLILGDNSISDISAIANLANLEWLDLADNSISDISAVVGLTNLTHLTLRDNSISDISAIAGLINVRSLSLNNNSVSDISAVVNLGNLASLNLESNLISDIVPIASLTRLRSLDLRHNSISDISPIAANKNLRQVLVQENPLSYSSIYTHIPSLQIQRGAVGFTRRTPTKLISISGDQRSLPAAPEPIPLVVEVRDEYDSAFEGVPVTFAITAGSGTLSITHTTTDRNGRAESTFTPGANLETNTVSISAAGLGVDDSIVFNILFDTQSPPILADVNADGNVNVLDLIIIASELGSVGDDLAADVSGDGVVNILDLVLAAETLGDSAAAPSSQRQLPETLTAAEIQQWLTDANSLEVKEVIMKRGILMLERLLIALTPTEPELLPNYPNPFNPETWIPYRLAENAFVTLTIYDLRGQVVRTFDVGHRIASVYESRSKAVYWDGRNELGEQATSGIYLYTLTAGDYSATRKMLILK